MLNNATSTSGVYRFRTKGQQWIFLQSHFSLVTHNTDSHVVFCKNHLININDALMHKANLPHSSSIDSQLSITVSQQQSPNNKSSPQIQNNQQQSSPLSQYSQQSPHQQQQQHSPLIRNNSLITSSTPFNEFKTYKKLDYYNYRNENSNSNSSQNSSQMRVSSLHLQQQQIPSSSSIVNPVDNNNNNLNRNEIQQTLKTLSQPQQQNKQNNNPIEGKSESIDAPKSVSKLILMSYQQPTFRKYVCTQLLLFKTQHEEKIKALQEKVGQFEEIIKFFQDGKHKLICF